MNCPGCIGGNEPVLLDEDGVLCSVSGNPGYWCHAYDGEWVPCDRKAVEEHAEIERLRKAIAPFAKAAPHMTVGKRLDPEQSGIWTAPDRSCRLSVADFQRAAKAAGGE